MQDVSPGPSALRVSPPSAWRTDDAWAIAAGLGLILVGTALTLGGPGFGWIAVTPPKWTHFPELAVHFAKDWPRYVAQFVLWSALIGVALRALGYRPGRVLPAFSLIYALSVVIFLRRTMGQRGQVQPRTAAPGARRGADPGKPARPAAMVG